MAISNFGYVRVFATDMDAWREYGTKVLGFVVGSGEDPDALYFRMDDHPHRWIIVPGEEDKLSAVGWECANEGEFEDVKRRLDAAGVPWAVVPGVPAYAAAAAELGVELTVPEVVQSVVLTRVQARSTAMPSAEALENFAATGATLVLHLAITRIRELAERLIPTHGADCPVAVVANASRPHRVELRGTLADIADAVEAAGLRQAAVILVGRALVRPGDAESWLYASSPDREAKRRG